ncbi:MAG: hypothetical protein IT204_15780 [Fimbriimonadaceae bacterium]|nr:hypothetical protein [Fimbriimonadaceae bacterium]
MLLLLGFTLCLASPVLIDGTDVSALTPAQLWEKSDEYFHNGQYAVCVRYCARLVELQPDNIEAYSVAAWLTWSLGDEPGGRRWLERCVQANPRHWEAHFNLGQHWLDRRGDAPRALPYLERAVNLPGITQPALRLLAHAYVTAEQPGRAVAWWETLRRKDLSPSGLIASNLASATAIALRSDHDARSGGVISGPAASTAPRILADRRRDDNGDGFAEARQLDLDDPTRPGDQVACRITYRGRRSVLRPVWNWTAWLADSDGDGALSDETALVDPDEDGLAESLPPLDQLRTARARLAPGRRRLVSPDRYELLTGPDGQPALPQVALLPERVLVTPPAYVATDRPGLRVELRLLGLTSRDSVAGSGVELPAGVYCLNSLPGPTAVLSAAWPPAGQRWLPVVELRLRGGLLDRKACPQVVVRAKDGTVRLEPAQPTELEEAFEPPAPVTPTPSDGPPRQPVPAPVQPPELPGQ